MKERPILFSAPMVRAILDGSKTQTRRIVKKLDERMFADEAEDWCPHGRRGDRLWVRETWKYWDWTEDGMPWIKYQADGETKLFYSRIPEDWSDRVYQVWTELSATENYKIAQAARDHKLRPSIFLPRWASRIDLEISGVRVERLQDISDEDCIAEGVVRTPLVHLVTYTVPGTPIEKLGARAAYQALWESINGAGSWDANPYVWVIEFKRIEK